MCTFICYFWVLYFAYVTDGCTICIFYSWVINFLSWVVPTLSVSRPAVVVSASTVPAAPVPDALVFMDAAPTVLVSAPSLSPTNFLFLYYLSLLTRLFLRFLSHQCCLWILTALCVFSISSSHPLITHFSPSLSNTIHLTIDLPSLGSLLANVFSIVIPNNAYPMKTRAMSDIFKPKAYLATCILSEPKHWKDAMYISEWKDAMKNEFDVLVGNDTWERFRCWNF